jgi:hypothetical protein
MTTQTENNRLQVLLTVDKTADALRTTRTAIYAMVTRVQTPGVVRIGRRVLSGARQCYRAIQALKPIGRPRSGGRKSPLREPFETVIGAKTGAKC